MKEGPQKYDHNIMNPNNSQEIENKRIEWYKNTPFSQSDKLLKNKKMQQRENSPSFIDL